MRFSRLGFFAASLFALAICNGQSTISTFYAFSSAGSAGLAIDAQGTVYLTDAANDRVRKISGGVLTIIAGNGTFGAYSGNGGPAVNAGININASGTSGVALDSGGNVYFSDSGNMVIRKIDAGTGVISTYAGNGVGAGTFFGSFSGDGGQALSAGLANPGDIAIDKNGNLYICDSDNNRIRKVATNGIITTVAGNGNVAFSGDNGPAISAGLGTPQGVAVDSQGNLYITALNRIRKVSAATGIITTFAGTGVNSTTGDGGLATAATTKDPLGIAADQFGSIYFTDRSSGTPSGGRVRKVDAGGIITSIAGIDGNASTPLGDGGPATSGFFSNPTNLMLDSSGNIYISTSGSSNGRIRKISASGAGFIANPSSLSFSYNVGSSNPASQTLNITSTAGVLSYTVSTTSTPTNWLSVATNSGTTPGTVTVSVNPAGLSGGGNYQGSILLTPTVAGNSPLSISVSLAVTGAGAPTINTTSGIANATGYQAKLAPDTVFSIFGSNLGPASIVIASPPNYPTTLSDTSVTFTPVGGGTPIQAKMYYTVSNAVAAILPSSITPGTYAVTVTSKTLTSAAQNVTVVARSFGIATSNSQGTGTAQATIGEVNGGLSLTRFGSGIVGQFQLSPAHPGQTLVLWGTGGGGDAQNDTGGSSGDQTAAGNFIVNLGSLHITPVFAGASFGYPGLFQVNFKIPADFTPDCFTTISVTAGGETGNTAVIPIAAAGQTTCTDPNVPPSIMSKIDAGTNINFGAFVVSKGTEALSGTTQETASGSVFSFTPTQWTILNSGPRFGACRLYDRTYPQNGVDPGSPAAFLNAGSKISISGPNIAAGGALSLISTALGPSYAASFGQGTLASSGSYTISTTGGTDVGPFSSTTVFPASFVATNFSSITAINRSQPLTFNWTGTGFDQVGIIVSSSLTANGFVHITTLNCTNIPAGPGTYTIPAAALATVMSAAATGSNFGNVSISAINSQGKLLPANLTAGGSLDISEFWSEINVAKNVAIQ